MVGKADGDSSAGIKEAEEDFKKIKTKSSLAMANWVAGFMLFSREGHLMPVHSIVTVIIASYSSLFYCFQAAFRKDLEFPTYVEYLNQLSLSWNRMFFHSQE